MCMRNSSFTERAVLSITTMKFFIMPAGFCRAALLFPAHSFCLFVQSFSSLYSFTYKQKDLKK